MLKKARSPNNPRFFDYLVTWQTEFARVHYACTRTFRHGDPGYEVECSVLDITLLVGGNAGSFICWASHFSAVSDYFLIFSLIFSEKYNGNKNHKVAVVYISFKILPIYLNFEFYNIIYNFKAIDD